MQYCLAVTSALLLFPLCKSAEDVLQRNYINPFSWPGFAESEGESTALQGTRFPVQGLPPGTRAAILLGTCDSCSVYAAELDELSSVPNVVFLVQEGADAPLKSIRKLKRDVWAGTYNGHQADLLSLRFTPRAYILDSDGNIVKIQSKLLKASELTSYVKDELGK